MDISLTTIKRHIVAELLIIRHARERNILLPEGSLTFWMYYSYELKISDYRIEEIINQDQEMANFFAEWEEYDTFLPADETRLSVITLAMKLVMAKALKYADDVTLSGMMASLVEKLKPAQYF